MIQAEAALQANDFPGWLAILNAARAFDPSLGLVPVADPGTPITREDLMFRERAFWLFGTGHRVGDLRRLVRQYGRDAETVFPTGAYHKNGATIGTDVSVAIPVTERNNPNFDGCLDRGA